MVSLSLGKKDAINAIKLSQNSCWAQVGGELANPNGVGDVGVRKLTTNLRHTAIC